MCKYYLQALQIKHSHPLLQPNIHVIVCSSPAAVHLMHEINGLKSRETVLIGAVGGDGGEPTMIYRLPLICSLPRAKLFMRTEGEGLWSISWDFGR
jgi:hypothetical protein